MKPMLRSVLLGALAAVHLCTTPVFAQEVGQVTNLPVPRFVSMKASEGNVRRGP
ncbi:MAG TPA: aspartyl-trna synthetase, partial [Sulfitobacter pontiacus]|nr:aspartyl-trna synthetase [Sulfitobacter pontiacus]